MIKVCSIREAKDFDGEIIAIVRSLKNPGKMKQLPALSPAWPLFKHYLSAKEAGEWNEEAFKEWYVPEFLTQITKDPAARKEINRLISEAEEINRCLVCFCTDEKLCHRSIIAGILQSYGVEVVAQDDYSAYGELYKKMVEKKEA